MYEWLSTRNWGSNRASLQLHVYTLCDTYTNGNSAGLLRRQLNAANNELRVVLIDIALA